jgi:exodeoxyribonuclease V beta subunit
MLIKVLPLMAEHSIGQDWQSLDLSPGGRSLIEASAGTGKTWTIAVLYLRLLLEGETPYSPRQVVVSTFTDAAAQELRERLRGRLLWAQAQAGTARDGGGGIDATAAPPDAAWLWSRWRGAAAQAGRDLLRLRLALAELDLAPIGTLHSLCRRILADFPVESGSAFTAAEVIGEGPLLDLLVDDLWRDLMQRDTPLDAGDALWADGTREALRDALRVVLAPGVGVRTAAAAAVTAAEWEELLAGARAAVAQPEHFRARNSRLLKTLGAFIAAGDSGALDSFDAESILSHQGELDKQFKAGANPQRAVTEALFQRLCQALEQRDSATSLARAAALERYRLQLLRRRREQLLEQSRVTFNMLIEGAALALRDPDGALALRLAAQWPVALVDEFQDTDAQQYAILDAIYRHGDGSARGRLVMIGDPKQAIYRFRGGDIHTYLRAAASAGARLRLDTNRRSSHAYVAALNQFYALAGAALSSDPAHEIRYLPVQSAGRDATPYRDAAGDIDAQPLVFHYCSDDPVRADERRAKALLACADQIAALLQSGRRIGDAAVQPGDIAVLVPKNDQIEQLRGLLGRRGVPCVGAGKRSVFEIELARELQLMLYAIDRWQDDGAVLAALATGFGGMDFAALCALREDADAWQQQRWRFEELQREWRRHGVLSVVLHLAAGLAARLPQLLERERALTDLRHLGELLQARSDEVGGNEQLLAWLDEQRRMPEQGEDAAEQQLRLESDARRVRLLTLHASKGLEFPIVFLPLMWDHAGHKPRTALVYDADSGRRLVEMDSKARPRALQLLRVEDQDERFRVLYVALTRAVHACHVYVLPPQRPRDGRSPAPATDPERAALDAAIARLLQSCPAQDLAAAAPQLAWRHDDWAWPPARYAAPRDSASALQARTEPPRPLFEHNYSFTALAAGRGREEQEEAAADDEAAGAAVAEIPPQEPAPDLAEPRILALSALRGPDFGNAVHAIFEQRRFGQAIAEQPELIERSLRDFAVRGEGLGTAAVSAALAELVQRNLDTEIAPGLVLGALPPAQLRAEMAFQFLLDGVSLRRLREACARHGAEALLPPQLSNATLHGLMSGKIDLIIQQGGRFHVLDYKTNYLGDALEDYAAARLAAAMDEHHYGFQALLYTVALERYLRQRLPGYRRAQHLGDCIYLFVRAVGLGPVAGIWRRRFDDALLDAVDAIFAGTGAAA